MYNEAKNERDDLKAVLETQKKSLEYLVNQDKLTQGSINFI